MVYKESKWFISRLNGLQAGRMVYKQAEWFTSTKAYKPAERVTVQVDRECKVAKMGFKKVKSSFIACQEEAVTTDSSNQENEEI